MIHFFDSASDAFYINEFGHSALCETHRVGPRVRSTYLLHIVISDVCRFSEFDVKSGEAFLISKDKKHDFTVNSGYEHFWFGFGGEKVPQLFSVFGIAENRHVHFYISDFPRIKELLYTSFERLSKEKSHADVSGTLFSVLPYLHENESMRTYSDVMRAKLFLERNYRHEITMLDAARHVSLSEKHLCRKFKSAFGMPPQKYLLKVRMERARELLLTGDMTVAETADSVGYTSPLTFSQMYKKYYGISPSKAAKK